jgi:hypothetical protein
VATILLLIKFVISAPGEAGAFQPVKVRRG